MTATPTVVPQPADLPLELLDQLRNELLAGRDEEARRALGSRRVADDLLAQGAAGAADAEAAERSASSAEEAVAAIDAALRRLADGAYGACVGCGGAISTDRLEAIPWAARCMPCSNGAGAGFLR